MSAVLDRNCGQQKIVRWIQTLQIDALRLRHFEKDDFVLVIGTIRGVRIETPISGRGGIGGSIADPYQPPPAISNRTLGPGRNSIREQIETHRTRGQL